MQFVWYTYIMCVCVCNTQRAQAQTNCAGGRTRVVPPWQRLRLECGSLRRRHNRSVGFEIRAALCGDDDDSPRLCFFIFFFFLHFTTFALFSHTFYSIFMAPKKTDRRRRPCYYHYEYIRLDGARSTRRERSNLRSRCDHLLERHNSKLT